MNAANFQQGSLSRHPQRPCAVCDGDAVRILFRQQFATISTGSFLEGYDVVVCERCGFAYADRIPGQQAFDDHYRDMSKYEYQNTSGHVSAFDQARFSSIVDLLMPYLPDRNASLLDVGCATGALLALFKEQGYRSVLGLDPSAECASLARRLYDIPVFDTPLSDLSARGQLFDCIILSGVLEHVQDMDALLAAARSLLADRGMVFVEVPDATRFALRPDAPFQEFSVEHINFFSYRSLSNLMVRHGFQAIVSHRTDRGQSSSTVMPVVSALWQKGPVGEAVPFRRDDETEAGLEQYIRRSRLIEDMIHQAIDRIVQKHIPILVWGVGTHTLRLLETSRLRDANIVAFVDSNPRYQQKMLEGLPIIAPADLQGRSEPILISSRVFQNEIESQIRNELILGNEIITIYKDV